MMNGLYVVNVDIENKSGHKDKILGQIDALSKITDHMYVLASNGNEYFFGEYLDRSIGKIMSVKQSKKIRYIRGFINQHKLLSLLRTMIDKHDVDFAYIRRIIPLTTSVLRTLRGLKKQKTQLFYEYPTYPWQEEMRSNPKTFGRLNYYLDKWNYRKLIDIVDFIPAMVSCDCFSSQIENEKLIKINNGVCVEKLPVVSPVSHEGLNLLAVGHLQNWHGFDRVIKGLSEFYNSGGTQLVKFLVVGDGHELQALRELAQNLGLVNEVVFFGAMTGKELDAIFNLSDIAVASIGNHRKKVFKDSALKSREYCARGIPFILASYDDDFPEEFRYVHRIPADDSPVDIASILVFFNSIKKDDYSTIMRHYAQRTLTWDKKMLPIIDKILQNQHPKNESNN